MDLNNLYLDMSSSSGSSSNSDGDDEIFLNTILPELLRNRPKNENYAEKTVGAYSEKEFLEQFRISKSLFETLSEQFENSEFYSAKDTGFTRITPEKSILIYLWYAGHEAGSFRDISDRFDISLSTMHEIMENVTKFLSSLSSTVITWPTEEEKVEISKDFERMGFPGVRGCMDGSHVRIDTPSNDPESYLNRKKYHSLQMQAVCDSRRKIKDVFIGFPGSVHDSRVFRNSSLFQTLQEKCGDRYILADSAYPCLRNVLTPFRDNGRLTLLEINFNKKLSHCRILIEHTFGLLKQKFRQLYHLKMRKIENMCHFIRACCVLHNLAIDDEFIEINDTNHQEQFVDIEGDDENVGNLVGHNFRNYISSILNI